MELNGVKCQNFKSLVSQHNSSEAAKKLTEPFLPSGPPVTWRGTTGFWALRLTQGEIFFDYEIFRHGGREDSGTKALSDPCEGSLSHQA